MAPPALDAPVWRRLWCAGDSRREPTPAQLQKYRLRTIEAALLLELLIYCSQRRQAFGLLTVGDLTEHISVFAGTASVVITLADVSSAVSNYTT